MITPAQVVVALVATSVLLIVLVHLLLPARKKKGFRS
jgi:preprotein translocase subunit Sec61beta